MRYPWNLFAVAGRAARRQNGDRRQHAIGAAAIRTDGAVVTGRNESARSVTPSAHAESRVLGKIGAGAVVYVARITTANRFAMAKPCRRCMSALKSKRIRKVYYTISPYEYGVVEWE